MTFQSIRFILDTSRANKSTKGEKTMIEVKLAVVRMDGNLLKKSIWTCSESAANKAKRVVKVCG
jgi:hypothetical protein